MQSFIFKVVFLFFMIFTVDLIQANDTSNSLSVVLKYLTNIAEQHMLNINEPVPVIGIGGCPGVGKTYLTKILIQQLQEKGIRCTVLPLDHFNLSTAERKKIGTEWDIRHFKVSELHSVLFSIQNGIKLIQKPTCNQLTGDVGFEIVDLNNVDLILFDGLYALCTKAPLHFFDYCTGGIFLEADEVDIFTWKWEREQKKAQPRTSEQFEKHMSTLINEYNKNIAYSKLNASFSIKKDSFHNYHLEDNSKNANLLSGKAA